MHATAWLVFALMKKMLVFICGKGEDCVSGGDIGEIIILDIREVEIGVEIWITCPDPLIMESNRSGFSVTTEELKDIDGEEMMLLIEQEEHLQSYL